MKRFFEKTPLIDLEFLFTEAETTINKTGTYKEGTDLYFCFLTWQAQNRGTIPFMFLNELYYEICKRYMDNSK